MRAKRIIQTITVIAVSSTLAAVVSCAAPGETKTYEQAGFTNYSETQVGRYIYEVRFDDTEGNKWKCFAMTAGYAGGLDGCEKVG